jgi:8-oxo-dGTP pyrophosphatase MutT (NUDIX family)
VTLADRLRSSLAVPAVQPPLAGDFPEFRASTSIPAAVLIGITDRSEPGVILTVRRETLRMHAGQIAFPGGRVDPGEDAVAAALREAHEELALEPSLVELVGCLDDYRTVTGYVVTPAVAVVPPDLSLTPHDHEVADWFEAPLGHLLDPARHELKTAVFAGRERRYWQVEWQGRQIWGATAAILINLARRLQWS